MSWIIYFVLMLMCKLLWPADIFYLFCYNTQGQLNGNIY